MIRIARVQPSKVQRGRIVSRPISHRTKNTEFYKTYLKMARMGKWQIASENK